ncbi:MAG TPA: hypothetical protein VF662_02405 [Allosphingosinicella sp.]|jgi:hypothetical protein
MDVHIHKGKKGIYGFTDDEAGAKLPAQHGPWTYEKKMDMNRGEAPRIAVSADDCLDDIEQQGYHLQKPRITSSIRTS